MLDLIVSVPDHCFSFYFTNNLWRTVSNVSIAGSLSSNLIVKTAFWVLDACREVENLTFDHEMFSTTIITLPLIQEGQFSVTAERMGTMYW